MNLTALRATASTILLLLLPVMTTGADPDPAEGYWTVEKETDQAMDRAVRKIQLLCYG